MKRVDALDPSRQVIVYCRSGARAGKAAPAFQDLGLNVRNLGGYSAAVQAGLKSAIPNFP